MREYPQDFSELAGRLTDTARASFERAGLIAHDSGSPFVGTEHVLLGVLAQNSSMGAKILAESGVTLDRVETTLDLTASGVRFALIDHGVHADVLAMIRTAWELAIEFGQSKIGTEHLVYSMLMQQQTRATRLLQDMNVDLETLRSNLEDVFDRQQLEAEQDSEGGASAVASSSLKILQKFGVDLTKRAREGLLDPMIGRKKELQRVITILGRRSKNNPALIGEPGVGKTAIVEGLAQKIVDGNVPEFLKGKKIVQLDLASMVAGTKFRGQFEERLQKVLAVVKKHQEIILFIDELHLLVGAGSAEGSMDASNILKPALARGEVRVIGATTFDEYRKHIEKDAALSRRFQAVTVAEPSTEEAVMMVRGLAERLGKHHQLIIDETAVQTAVDLSERYVSERFLPDKAIDVLDEAAALMRAETPIKTGKRQRLARAIKQLAGKIDAAVEAEDYERAANFKTQMKQLEQQAATLKDSNEVLSGLSDDYLRRAVSAMSGVPVERVTSAEVKQLGNLEKRLAKFVLGQNEAISELSRAIRRSKAGLSRRSGPLGSFIFLGPTGVGKTELARVVAREVFGSDNNLIKIDMSEFAEKHTASRLVGAPAGYVGYDDGGKLTDRVRRQPYSVVLFDEIEKAHPDVLNLLLQLLEDGQLTDAKGRSVSFRNTIVILTSNVGGERMVREAELGFSYATSAAQRSSEQSERNEQAARQALDEFLRPELIGRFDNIIVFKPLTRKVAGKIFDKIVSELVTAVEKQGMKLVILPSVKRRILNDSFDEQRGARAIRRAVQAVIGDPLSEVILKGVPKSAVLRASVKNGEVVIDVESQ